MISRKWLYSYRMLTARLHEGTPAPTNRMTGFAVGSVPPPPQQIVGQGRADRTQAHNGRHSQPEEKHECLQHPNRLPTT